MPVTFKNKEGQPMAFSFLKTGAASAELAKKNEAEAEQRRQEQGKLFRFYLKDKEEARITFVDGELSPEGFLLPPRYYEHNLFLNGSWNNNFVCPEKTNPDSKDKCPLCEADDRPSLVALFTVIDHRNIQGTKDKTKFYKDTKKLLVAKPQSFEILNKIAVKRGGLACGMFDVSRSGDKSASIGSMFDFVEKKDLKVLRAAYMIEKVDPKTNVKTKVTNFEPADYEKEIIFRTGTELRKLGLGKNMGGGQTTESGDPVDYSGQL